jgi:hypothetical protein
MAVRRAMPTDPGRRAFLGALAAAGLVPLAACAPRPDAPASRGATLFIPGFRARDLDLSGEPADSRARRRVVMAGTTLLTRLAPDGSLRQAVYPIIGHDVAIAPDGATGLMARMGNSGRHGEAHHVLFDAATLELVAEGPPPVAGWRGGGHGVFLPGGPLLTAERAPAGPYAGHPQAHYGRIALRDPRNLRLIDTIPCHGIDPHEIRLSADGRQVLAANYGSVADQGTDRIGVPRRVVEASVTVTDLTSGRLVEKVVTRDPGVELRHLALAAGGQVFGIRCRLDQQGTDAALQADLDGGTPDATADEGAYLPAAPVLVADGAAQVLAASLPPDQLRHGLSVEYDPTQGEFLATFPSSHRLLIFAATGRLRRTIDTRALGLRHPCGLALLDDGTYAVAGYRQGVLVLTRGSHQPVRHLATDTPLHGHSHMTAV